MSAEFKIRKIVPEDTAEILELLTISLKGSIGIPRSREYWEWKHEKNPFGPSYAIAAEQDGKIIGVRTFMRWLWKSGKQEIRSVRAVDTVTHPDWRGRGIFSRLTSTLLENIHNEDVSFVFNTPNPSSKPGYLKLGWKELTKLPLWLRLRPLRMISELVIRHPDITETASSRISEILPQVDLETCLTDIHKDARLHTERTRKYLSWRYAEIPGFTYFAKYKRKQDGAALIIFRIRLRKGVRELRISELLASSGKSGERVGKELLDETIAEFPSGYSVAIAANKTVESSSLRKSLFLRTPHIGPCVTIRKLQDSASLQQWSNWRCSIGDFELL